MADQVSSLFSQKWFEELEKTKTFLTEIDSQIAGLVKDRRDVQIQIKGVDTLKEFNALAQKLQVLTDNLVSANGKYSNSQARTANTTKLLTAETAKARVEQQNHNKTMVQGAKEALGLISVYDALSAEHRELSKTAREAGAAFGIESKEFKSAADRANEAGSKLSAIDQKLGNYRRNVGNYASGWNGLGNAINQLSREAPAFANSLQTGFMALSNNIPILADEIGKIRAQNAALVAEGKPVVSTFKQITSALFSWQTGLSLGVTLLTVYGKDIADLIGQLFKGEKKLSDLEVAFSSLNKINQVAADTFAKQSVQLDLLQKRFFDVGATIDDKKEVVKELNKAFGDTIGKIDGINEAENFFINNGANFRQSLLLRAQIEGAYNAIVENTSKLLKEQAKGRDEQLTNGQKNANSLLSAIGLGGVAVSNTINQSAKNVQKLKSETDSADKFLSDFIVKNTQRLDALMAKFKPPDSTGIIETMRKSLENLDKQIEKESSTDKLKALVKERKNLQEELDKLLDKQKKKRDDSPKTNATQQTLERDLIIQKAISSNESLELERRLSALDKAAKDKRGIAKEDLKLEKITADELKTELVKIDTETADERNKIIDKYYDNYQKEFDAHVKKQEQNALAQADNIHIIYRNQYDNEIEELKKKNLTKRQFEKQSAAIAKRIALDEVNKQIESLEQIRFAYAQLQMDVSDIDKQLENLKDKRSKLNTNKGVDQSAFNTLGVSDEDVSKIQQALDIYGKFSQALTGFTDIFQQQSQHRIDSINAEIEAIKTRSDAEVEALENAGLSEEEKQDKIDEIKARAAEKEQQLLDKRRQEQKKQAAFQKAADIASIISGTAVAVVAALGSKPFTPFNIALAAIVGTLGAAQLTAALASPLPQFYTGTESSPEGLAKVGERGSELMVMPNGRMFVTPNQETIAWLQKGTKIYPHEETKNIMRVLNRDSTQMPTGSITDYKLHSLIKDQTSEIVGAVKRIGNVSVNQRYPGWFSDWSIQKTR